MDTGHGGESYLERLEGAREFSLKRMNVLPNKENERGVRVSTPRACVFVTPASVQHAKLVTTSSLVRMNH